MSSYSNWYQHDFDAGNDPKIMQLEMDYGLEGYGLYHRILEHMGTADGHSLTEKEINYIAKKCFSKIENCCEMFLALKLFSKQNNGQIISKSLIKRLKELDEKHNKRVIAGRKGGQKKSSNAKAKLQANHKQKSSNALPLDKTILDKNTIDNTKKKSKPKDFLSENQITWIDQSIWEEWIDFKKKKKASTSKRALDMNIKKLRDFGTHTANEIISQSLNCGWSDFYELKSDKPKFQTQQEKNNEFFAAQERKFAMEEENGKDSNTSDAIILNRV